MTSLLVVLAGWVPISAQGITYNLEPTHELGPELWSIPIGGRLTMSADGTRMLVASIADSAFYVVDVETGEYRRLSQPYYSDNTFGTTFYVVDNDLTVLAQRNSLDFTRGLFAWDIDADTVVSELQAKEGTFGDLEGVSLKHDRLVYDGLLESLQTRDHIAMHDLMYAPAWFDDDRGVFYCSRDRVVGEFDAETGELKRTWGVRSLESEVRRPSNSDWLYVFSLETDFANPQNWVEAINLVTGERLTFEEFFWDRSSDHPVFLVGDEGSIVDDGSVPTINGFDGGHLNVAWTFDAERRSSQVVFDLLFYLDGSPGMKTQAVDPHHTVVCHSWWDTWKDSSITRCNALVPVSTSVSDVTGEGEPLGVSTYVADDFLHVEPEQLETIIQHVDVATVDGALVLQEDITDPMLPVRLPIGHLANGTYLCSVQTSMGRFSSTFTIQR